MCGIAGVVELERGREPSPEGLVRMARVLAHRGPDEEGFYRAGPVGLAHRRLSIIDLASGQQPMQSPDGRVCLVFNGEIYNYPELRAALERDGHAFRTRSDTEVLLALYVRDGLDAFPRLNGMFACAFWDGRTRELVLARDRLGKKPLFYYQDDRRFLFGSEIKALLAFGGVERRVNPLALDEYLAHSYIVGEGTIFEGIRRLPPAHLLVLKDGVARTERYWTLRFEPGAGRADEREVLERLTGLLEQAVRRRLLSEVPLGAFLSGGLDSSTVAALMARVSGQRVRTFTVGFEEADYSEVEDARVVARHIGSDHHEVVVRPSALEVLPDLVWHFDEPFGDSSAVPTYYVCRAARQQVTVALSGDGGDEVFAGYTRYLSAAGHGRAPRAPGWVRRGVARPLVGALPFTLPGWNYLYAMSRDHGDGLPHGLGIYPYIRDMLYTPEFRARLEGSEPFGTTEQLLRASAHLDPVSRYQYLDTLQYLPADILTKVDRTSMASSLEVRSPLLDHTLVEYMATVPVSLKLEGGVSKLVLRKIVSGLLPPSVLAKRKMGFGIPGGRWFQRELREAAEALLLDRRTLARGYLREDTVRRLLRHHASGRRDYGTWIWCLVVLETWFRLFLDTPLDTPVESLSASAAGWVRSVAGSGRAAR